jgi:hypothetical protein
MYVQVDIQQKFIRSLIGCIKVRKFGSIFRVIDHRSSPDLSLRYTNPWVAQDHWATGHAWS